MNRLRLGRLATVVLRWARTTPPPAQPTTTCPNCDAKLPGTGIACRPCWKALPPDLRYILTATARIAHQDHAPFLDALQEARHHWATTRKEPTP